MVVHISSHTSHSGVRNLVTTHPRNVRGLKFRGDPFPSWREPLQRLFDEFKGPAEKYRERAYPSEDDEFWVGWEPVTVLDVEKGCCDSRNQVPEPRDLL